MNKYRLVDWKSSQDIEATREVLLFVFNDIPAAQSRELLSRIRMFGIEKGTSLDRAFWGETFEQVFNFDTHQISVRFTFDVDAANSIAKTKKTCVVPKIFLEQTPFLQWDTQAGTLEIIKTTPIIIAPLVNWRFILDGNHRFVSKKSHEMVEYIFLDYLEAAQLIIDPIARDFYTIFHEIYFTPTSVK